MQAAVLNLIGRLQSELGFACLFITHDLAAVEFLAQRVAVMYLGQLVEVADRATLFRAPRHPYTQALLSAAPVPGPGPAAVPAADRALRRGAEPGVARRPGAGSTRGVRLRSSCAPRRCRALRPVGPAGELVACHLVADDGTGPRLAEVAEAG